MILNHRIFFNFGMGLIKTKTLTSSLPNKQPDYMYVQIQICVKTFNEDKSQFYLDNINEYNNYIIIFYDKKNYKPPVALGR